MTYSKEQSNYKSMIKMREKRAQRRELVNHLLGDKCVKCGSTEHLVVDHIDPSTKSFNIGEHLCGKWEEILEELKKCQLLCFKCHVEKTAIENTKNKHGTLSMYMPGKRQRAKGKMGCRCPECVAVWKEYQSNRRKLLKSKDK